MMDNYKYKILDIDPHRRRFESILKQYEASDKYSPEMKQTFKIIMGNTFIHKDNKTRTNLKKKSETLAKKNKVKAEKQAYFNNNLNILKYLNKYMAAESLGEIYINSNRGYAYLEIREERSEDDITACYLDELISSIDSLSPVNNRVIMFCNINIEIFENKLRKLFSVIKNKKIKTLYMANYTHVYLKDEVSDSLQFIFTEREKALNHFVCIITDVSQTTQRIAKRDPTTGINFSLHGNQEVFKKVTPFFTRHHANRMLKILQDARHPNPMEYLPQELLGQHLKDVREDVEERHTIMITKGFEHSLGHSTKKLGEYLHKLSKIDISLENPLARERMDDLKLHKENELKLLRNRCLKEYNIIHAITNADTAILKTSVWMIYSLKMLGLQGDTKKNNELRKMLDDTKQNSEIWNAMRKFRNFFSVTSHFPVVKEEEVKSILIKIYFEDGSLSKYFPDIPFSANMYSLQGSLENLIYDDRLRKRLSVFFKKDLFSPKDGAMELAKYLDIDIENKDATIHILLKSERRISLVKNDIIKYFEKYILKDIIEGDLWKCVCSLGGANGHCECNGGIVNDDLKIKDIQTYNEKRISSDKKGEGMIRILLKSGKITSLNENQLKTYLQESVLENILKHYEDITEKDFMIDNLKIS